MLPPRRNRRRHRTALKKHRKPAGELRIVAKYPCIGRGGAPPSTCRQGRREAAGRLPRRARGRSTADAPCDFGVRLAIYGCTHQSKVRCSEMARKGKSLAHNNNKQFFRGRTTRSMATTNGCAGLQPPARVTLAPRPSRAGDFFGPVSRPELRTRPHSVLSVSVPEDDICRRPLQ